MQPSAWFPPILATMIERHALHFTLAGEEIHSDELTDGQGFGALLAFLINRRLPGAIPLWPSVASPCAWEAQYDAIELPISLLGAVALDAVLALAETAEHQHVALDPVLIKMDSVLNSSHPLLPLITGGRS